MIVLVYCNIMIMITHVAFGFRAFQSCTLLFLLFSMFVVYRLLLRMTHMGRKGEKVTIYSLTVMIKHLLSAVCFTHAQLDFQVHFISYWQC